MVGEVPVEVTQGDDGWRAALTSVEPEQRPADDALVAEALQHLGWSRDELDESIPPMCAYAGAWHLVLATSADRLARLDYAFEPLADFMNRNQLTTLQLIHRESPTLIHSRNPFPVGGVVEDPATGAAAAALGGYLRAAGLVNAPATLLIRQGETMGRPSRLTVEIPVAGGIVVSGTAVALE